MISEQTPMPDAFNKIVSFVQNKGLETPAVFFLETIKPLSFLASQMVLMSSPFLGFFFKNGQIHEFSRFMADRGNVESVIRTLESR